MKKRRKGNRLLRSPEGDALISSVSGNFNREVELTRQNKSLRKLLDQRGKEQKTFSVREVKEQVGLD